jgi:hypothetical protein
MIVYSRVLAETYICDGMYASYVMGYRRGDRAYKRQQYEDGDQFMNGSVEILGVTKKEFELIQERNPVGDMAYYIEDILSDDFECGKQ